MWPERADAIFFLLVTQRQTHVCVCVSFVCCVVQVCDSQIMFLSRASRFMCVRATTAISHRCGSVCKKTEWKSYLLGSAVILFNQNPGTHTLLCTLSTCGSCLPSLRRPAAAFCWSGVGMERHGRQRGGGRTFRRINRKMGEKKARELLTYEKMFSCKSSQLLILYSRGKIYIFGGFAECFTKTFKILRLQKNDIYEES